MSRQVHRRHFLMSTSAAAAGLLAYPRRGRADDSPNEKVRFACIGIGGKGGSDSDHAAQCGEVVAICDIDDHRLARKAKQLPRARTYNDFRKLLDEMDDQIDAVVVSTPDHTHAVAAISAMKRGKHVYCQKPLAHSVGEARRMMEEARKHNVATQMGNQGTADDGFRRGVEIIRSGVIGPIQEVHVWTNRPFKYWKQAPDIVARPKDTPPVPDFVHWNLWLGPAPERPYNPVYHPHDWRGWWDFGTGSLGDMACHTTNLPFMGLKLGYPTRVSAISGPVNDETYPAWATITYEFPARGDLPPVKLTWYEGAKTASATCPTPSCSTAATPPTAARSSSARRAPSTRPATTAWNRSSSPPDSSPTTPRPSPRSSGLRARTATSTRSASGSAPSRAAPGPCPASTTPPCSPRPCFWATWPSAWASPSSTTPST